VQIEAAVWLRDSLKRLNPSEGKNVNTDRREYLAAGLVWFRLMLNVSFSPGFSQVSHPAVRFGAVFNGLQWKTVGNGYPHFLAFDHLAESQV